MNMKCLRHFSASRPRNHWEERSKNSSSTMFYASSVVVFFIGLSFAAVPLYQLVCSTTGIDGTPKTGAGTKFTLSTLKTPEHARPLKIFFDSSTSAILPWKFEPETRMITVKPGESALAFFKAVNYGERVTGISTYSVVPYKAAQYFNKIQCFCFEEQRLEKGEEVDMPVFFFIDPEFATDPWMKDVNEITLHYTFFKSKVD